MTLPDKPNSRFQKYLLTAKGIELKEILLSYKKQQSTNETVIVSESDYPYSQMKINLQTENLIKAMDSDYTLTEIMQKLQLKNKAHLKLEYLKPALKSEIIEILRKAENEQTYRLTKKGLEIKKQLGDLLHE
jgi:predicted transcriptional regulator